MVHIKDGSVGSRERAEVFARRVRGRESFPSTRTHAEDAKERKKEKEEIGRRAERQRR